MWIYILLCRDSVAILHVDIWRNLDDNDTEIVLQLLKGILSYRDITDMLMLAVSQY